MCKLILAVVIVICTHNSCRSVKRLATGEKLVDLTGDWNDNDYRITSADLCKKLAHKNDWINKFYKKHNRYPKIMVGYIRNHTSEHNITKIMHVLIKNIEQKLIDFNVIVSGNQDLRKEAEQLGLSPSLRNKLSKGANGVDYIITGNIYILDSFYGREKTVTYMIDLSLINLKTGNTDLIVIKDDIKKYIVD